ncbi:hypothetical protein RI367_003545 [Sorochytrium milnesiophthora]
MSSYPLQLTEEDEALVSGLLPRNEQEYDGDQPSSTLSGTLADLAVTSRRAVPADDDDQEAMLDADGDSVDPDPEQEDSLIEARGFLSEEDEDDIASKPALLETSRAFQDEASWDYNGEPEDDEVRTVQDMVLHVVHSLTLTLSLPPKKGPDPLENK